jgi:hypothetical protein
VALIFICFSFIFEISRIPFSNRYDQHVSNFRAKNENFDKQLILMIFMSRMTYAEPLREGVGGNFCRVETGDCGCFSRSILRDGANVELFWGES